MVGKPTDKHRPWNASWITCSIRKTLHPPIILLKHLLLAKKSESKHNEGMLRFVISFLLSFGSASVFAEPPALTTKGTSACDWKWVRECTGLESVRWHFEAQRLIASVTEPSVDVSKKLVALVLSRRTYENNEQTIRWWWRLQNSRETRGQCVLQKVSRPFIKLPGAQMWTFVPTPAYRQELLDKELPDDEPCGEWAYRAMLNNFILRSMMRPKVM